MLHLHFICTNEKKNTSPAKGSRRHLRRRLMRSWCINITPSINMTLFSRQASRISMSSAASSAAGFSIRRCFLAVATLIAHSKCKVVGSGRYTAWTFESSSKSWYDEYSRTSLERSFSTAKFFAFSIERDATATRFEFLESSIAWTFLFAIFAQEISPQLMISILPLLHWQRQLRCSRQGVDNEPC